MTHCLGRRPFLATVGTLGLSSIAGCLGDNAGGTGTLGDPATAAAVDVVFRPIPGFEPGVVHVEPGSNVEWHVVSSNRHTVTAYHPETYGSKRIPTDAAPWHSGWLREGDVFDRTFELEGIYDYVDTRTVCASHEAIGLVGRVVVGWPDVHAELADRHATDDLPGRAATVMREYDEACREVLG